MSVPIINQSNAVLNARDEGFVQAIICICKLDYPTISKSNLKQKVIERLHQLGQSDLIEYWINDWFASKFEG